MSKVTIKRVLIPDETFDGSAILKALQELLHEVLQDSALRQCVLYIPTKGALQGTTLEGALGTKASKALLSNKRLPLESSSLRLETDASFKGYTPCDAVVVIYADQKMMDKVDSNPHPKLVICVPRLLEAVDSWKRSWGPITPNKPQEDFELIGNKVVEAALLSMTSRINLGNQVLSSLDQESVKDAFRILARPRILGTFVPGASGTAGTPGQPMKRSNMQPSPSDSLRSLASMGGIGRSTFMSSGLKARPRADAHPA